MIGSSINLLNLHQRATWKGYHTNTCFNLVSNTLQKITPDVTERSFETCGVKANGQKVEVGTLNRRQRGIPSYHKGIEEMQEGEENSSVETSKEDEIGENLDAELDILA